MIRYSTFLIITFVFIAKLTPEVSCQLANCQNYGTPINATDCQCPAYVGGRLCETVKCQRFSVPDKNRCACAPGWYDKYCGLRGCRPPNEDNLNMEKRSMIIVFNMKSSMKWQLDTLKNNFKNMVKEITTDRNNNNVQNNWIESFIVYGFVQSGGSLNTTSIFTDSSDDVLAFLNNIVLSEGDATQPVLTAVQNAQQTFPRMRSHGIVLVFTDSPASEATPWSHRFTDKNAEQIVLQISLLWRSKYSFFLSLPTESDTSSNGIDVYRRLSLTNHADTFFVSKSDELQEALLNVIGTQYFPENLAIAYGKTGTENVQFTVDTNDEIVFVLLTIDSFTSSVLPTASSTANGFGINSQGTSYRLYSMKGRIGDTLTINASAGTIYNYRVFVQTKSTLLFDYNDDMHIDVGNGMAVIGIGMSSTMQTYGFPEFSNSSYDVRSSDGSLIRDKFYSYLRLQEDCTFLYGFPVWDTLTCPAGPITQLHTFYYNGMSRQRVTPGYCIESDHNAEHPNGVTHDEKKLLDSSESATDNIQCSSKILNGVSDPRLVEPKQYIFILEQHSDNKQVYDVLVREIFAIIGLIDSTTNETYSKEFTLVVHDDKESHVLLSHYNPAVFIVKFINLVSNLKLQSNLDNNMGLLSIVQAQKMNIQSTAQVYYFTNQAVKNVQNITRNWDLVNRDIEVNFFTIADGVTTEIFALPKNLELIQKMSNGRLIPLTKSETSLVKLFADMVTVTALTTDQEQYDCHTTPLTINGYVEDGAKFSVIQVIGTGLKSVQIQDSNGALISVSDYITYQNPNFLSMNIDSKLFASGVWRISATATTGGCQITVRQKTSVGVILGFVSNQNDDDVSTQIISQRSFVDNQPIHAPIRVTSGIVPTGIEIQLVNTKRYDQPQSFANLTVTPRDSASCTYNYISGSVMVPKNPLTTWTVSAYQSGKLMLHRMFYYYQHVPADPSVCQGGQVDQFGRCICPERYTGDYCWDRICQPPATYSFGICSCPPGYYGDFCEIELVLTSNTSTVTSAVTSTIATTTSFSNSHLSMIALVLSVTLVFVQLTEQ